LEENLEFKYFIVLSFSVDLFRIKAPVLNRREFYYWYYI